jgi:diadenosine tetraphosphatase ApaH/serine/threonine PP2A family protein phosphatase
VLDTDSTAFLAGLQPSGTAPGVELFHGSARDPVWDYVLDDAAAQATLDATSAPLVLVGHSHVALEISGTGGLRGGQASPGTVLDLDAGRRILNPGSVGQPRDGDPRASWLVIDAAPHRATFRRTDYPIERTQAEMRERDLPEVLSERLAHGA